jgi:signal peptidase I
VAEPGGAQQPVRGRTGARAWIAVVLGALLATTLVTQVVLGACVVDGDSMLPTLRHGERVLILKLHGALQRGDLVVVKNPWAPDELLVKRVLGLPGDALSVERGRLCVGGFEQGEPYLSPGTPLEGLTSPTEVPDASYFLLGDNRPASVDSRRFGAVPAHLVVGKVVSGW